jgi:hypothetical protein
MRFKLDENLSQSVAALFRGSGHDALTVCDQGLQAHLMKKSSTFRRVRTGFWSRLIVISGKSSAFRPR